MPKSKRVKLTETKCREIFLATILATRQGGLDDREQVAERFGLTDQELAKIEREGISRCWPPLD